MKGGVSDKTKAGNRQSMDGAINRIEEIDKWERVKISVVASLMHCLFPGFLFPFSIYLSILLLTFNLSDANFIILMSRATILSYCLSLNWNVYLSNSIQYCFWLLFTWEMLYIYIYTCVLNFLPLGTFASVSVLYILILHLIYYYIFLE